MELKLKLAMTCRVVKMDPGKTMMRMVMIFRKVMMNTPRTQQLSQHAYIYILGLKANNPFLHSS